MSQQAFPWKKPLGGTASNLRKVGSIARHLCQRLQGSLQLQRQVMRELGGMADLREHHHITRVKLQAPETGQMGHDGTHVTNRAFQVHCYHSK